MTLEYDKNGYLKPGIYENFPEHLYHRGPEISNSKLKVFADSAHLYHGTYITKELGAVKESDPMELGSYFHAITLEPDKHHEHYICEYSMKAQKGQKERMEAQNDGVYPITKVGYDTARWMRDSTLKNDLAAMVLKQGKPEVSFFGVHESTGINIRSRTDWIDPSRKLAADLKSIRDIHPKIVSKTIEERRWHVQEAFYTYLAEQHGIPIDNFIWIVTESKAPYTCIAQPLVDQLRDYGKDIFEENMQDLAQCIEKNDWPVYNYNKNFGFDISPYGYDRN